MRIKIMTVLAVVLGLCSLAQAQEVRSAIDKVLESSGFSHMLEALPDQFKQGMAQGFIQGGGDMMSPEFTNLMKAADEAYAVEYLYAEVADYFAAQANADYLQVLQDWYDTELGARITQLENAANTAEAQTKIMQYAAQIAQNPPASARVDLLATLDQKVHASDMAIQVTLATMRGTIEGSGTEAPADIEDILDQTAQQLRPMMVNQVQITFLYTYRDLTDEELRQYVEFYDSAAGQWFVEQSEGALLTAIGSAAQRMGEQFNTIFPEADPAATESMDAQAELEPALQP